MDISSLSDGGVVRIRLYCKDSPLLFIHCLPWSHCSLLHILPHFIVIFETSSVIAKLFYVRDERRAWTGHINCLHPIKGRGFHYAFITLQELCRSEDTAGTESSKILKEQVYRAKILYCMFLSTFSGDGWMHLKQNICFYIFL